MKKSKSRRNKPRLRSIRDHIRILSFYNPQSAMYYKQKGLWRLEMMMGARRLSGIL